MAIVLRAALRSYPSKRVWINGVHDEGNHSSPVSLYTAPPPAEPAQLRPPLIARNQGRFWISGLHDQGSIGSTEYIPPPPVPFQNPEFPAPAPRKYGNDLRAWLNENPNLYSNEFPVGDRTDFTVPRESYYDPNLKTWINQNPNLYTNPFPVGAESESLAPPELSYPEPLRTWVNSNVNLNSNPQPVLNPEFPAPSPRATAADLHTWVYGSTAYIPAPVVQPPFQNPEFPAPPLRATAADLHTWVFSYTPYLPVTVVQQPFQNPEFPVPSSRLAETRTWTNQNPNLYTNAVPVLNPEFPAPPSRYYGPSLLTWISSNPVLYTVVPPADTAQIRPPLIARNQGRVWINGLHDQGTYGAARIPETPIVQTLPPNPEFPVPAKRAVAADLFTWVYGSTAYTPVTPIVQTPPPNPALPVPPSRPISIELRTWISGNNPNLYEAEIPPVEIILPRAAVISKPQGRVWIPAIHGAWVFSYTPYLPAPFVQPPFKNPEFPAPKARSVSIELRTWLNSNPNLYTNPEPVQNPEFPAPKPRPIDVELRTWVRGSTAYIPPPEAPLPGRVFPVPESRQPDNTLRTWVQGTTVYIYVQTPRPQPNPEWPTAQARPRSIDLLSWTHSNNGLYANPIPFNQTNWPTPVGRSHGPEQKIWSVPTNPNLFTPPTVLPSAGNDKQFIGEIQSLGLGSIFDSSMGVT